MILAGLWCSTEKPPMQLFFKPIIDALCVLENEGLHNADYADSVFFAIIKYN